MFNRFDGPAISTTCRNVRLWRYVSCSCLLNCIPLTLLGSSTCADSLILYYFLSSKMNPFHSFYDSGLAYLLQLISIASFGNGSSKAELSGSVDPDSRRLQQPQWLLEQNSHAITPLSDDQMRNLAGMSNKEQFLRLLQPILIPRVAGTPGNAKVQQVSLKSLSPFP